MVAVGRSAGQTNTTGRRQVFVGYNSGYNNTTGDFNTNLGYAAGYTNATGERNVKVGFEAGYFGTGDSNTLVGAYAGGNISTGGNNLMLGRDSGTANSPSGGITSGGNIVCLGNDNISDLYCADTSISSSDSRDKTEIANFTHGLDWVNKLQPKTYVWDKRSWYSDDLSVTPDGSKKKTKKNIGFLAQDVLAVEQADGFASSADNMLIINLTEDGKRYGLKYERLVPVLVNAIKELSSKNSTLETRIAALEAG
jgi:hypothetical protein